MCSSDLIKSNLPEVILKELQEWGLGESVEAVCPHIDNDQNVEIEHSVILLNYFLEVVQILSAGYRGGTPIHFLTKKKGI